MTPEVFGEWLQRQGVKVVRSASSYWHTRGSRVYQAFPYHWLIQPSEAEVRDLLRSRRAVALRYSTGLSSPAGMLSYHVVRRPAAYGLETLDKKARYDVRKGLAYSAVEPISFARLADEGWPMRAETLARQGRTGAETKEEWQRLCRAAEGLPGFEAWGALHDGELAASLLAFTCGDCCSFIYQQSADLDLKHGVNYALAYSFTREAQSRPGVSLMFYSLHSLDAAAGVDQFKFRIGYTAQPVRQRVAFHPWAAPLVNRVTHSGLERLARRQPGLPALAKAEGMVRFYLEGQLPLARQVPPAGVEQARLT